MTVNVALAQLEQRSAGAVSLPAPIEVEQLPTPALVLDRAILESNIEKMREHLGAHGKGFRPHAKTHKCPIISRLQMEAGAVGVCAAKVSEAAALLLGGVEQILITSPLATASKVAVLNELLMRGGELYLVVDSLHGLKLLEDGLSPDVCLGVLVDLDLSMGRTGLRDEQVMLQIVDKLHEDPRFHFVGIQHYAGHIMHIADYSVRREKSLQSWHRLADKCNALDERGIEVGVLTGGGTGTYDIDVQVDRITDLQVGSYIFMDEEYRGIAGPDSERFEAFDLSLRVACSTISQPKAGLITVDGGYKAFASDSVNPVCDEIPNVQFRFAGDEHGVLLLGDGQQEVRLGQVLEFAVPHCDPTVNLHDMYWVREPDGLIHSYWPITARGCSW